VARVDGDRTPICGHRRFQLASRTMPRLL
jgi:hypothetical protein